MNPDHLRSLEQIEQAVALKPRHAAYRDALGLALSRAGRYAEAVAAFRHAVRLDKSCVSALCNLGRALAAQGEHVEAAQLFRRAIAVAPGLAGARNGLGNTLAAMGEHARAADAFREALNLDPTAAQLHINLATMLMDLRRETEAGALFRQALDLAPYHPTSYANYGIWLRTAGDLAGSEACLRTGLALAPDDRLLHHALAQTLLSIGRMREGFAENEFRLIPTRYAAPAWTGEAGPGRTVLITLGEGRGDVIQFLRYVPLAAERVHVVMETSPSLRRLAASVSGIAALFCPGEPVPDHDMVCSLLSLPHLLGVDAAPLGMDAERPYLRPDPDDVAGWAGRVAALPGCRIGLVWAGAADFALDRRRSVPPALLDALQRDDVSFVSLQKDASAKPGMQLTDWTGELQDFADTAALVANLDLIISVDTAVAHLAGALGKPVWLLNRFDSDWRWLREGERSAWYPSLRQFRQPQLGDWSSVMTAVQVALAESAGRPGM